VVWCLRSKIFIAGFALASILALPIIIRHLVIREFLTVAHIVGGALFVVSFFYIFGADFG